MPHPPGDNRTTRRGASGAGLSLSSEPVVLALLSVAAVVGFMLVGSLSSTYHAQHEAFAVKWFARGSADLHARRFGRAVSEFRTALLYSPDNYSYQFNLAEALLGEHRTDEAAAYLVNLWEREPDNALVSLELARIAAGRGEPQQAIRYYHNAIYATWPANRPEGRQQTRLELIDYLLTIDEKPQAQAELIALAANLGDDPVKRAHVGDLFVEAGDYVDALAAYDASLRAMPKNQAAATGAGLAAFELGRYAQARQYLRQAAAVGPLDEASAARLETADLVLRMDPYRRQISAAERNRIVIAAFTAAGERLAACAPKTVPAAPTSDGQDLSKAWQKMKPQVTPWGLWRNPDLVEGAMDLVFGIERRFAGTCASPTPTDRALLLIAGLHEGS
jgi:tetratricopeptide (TPR) repeat protein